MSTHFEELFTIQGVHGVFHVGDDGKSLYSNMADDAGEFPADQREVISFLTEKIKWDLLSPLSGDATDGEILYDALSIYYRKTNVGLLLVLMAPGCVVSMVRMTCDLVASDIEKPQKSKGFGRFFKL